MGLDLRLYVIEVLTGNILAERPFPGCAITAGTGISKPVRVFVATTGFEGLLGYIYSEVDSL